MGEKRVFMTEKPAVTGGPYSQAIIHNGLVYVSGQGAGEPETNQLKLGTMEKEAELALNDIQIILKEARSSLVKVLKVTVYLLDIEDYGRFNEVYKRYFKKDRPARVCLQAGKLPFDTRVEIDAIGYISTEI